MALALASSSLFASNDNVQCPYTTAKWLMCVKPRLGYHWAQYHSTAHHRMLRLRAPVKCMIILVLSPELGSKQSHESEPWKWAQLCVNIAAVTVAWSSWCEHALKHRKPIATPLATAVAIAKAVAANSDTALFWETSYYNEVSDHSITNTWPRTVSKSCQNSRC